MLPKGTPSIAQAFADHFGTKVYGFRPHVTTYARRSFYGESVGFNFHNFLGRQHFHNGPEIVFPNAVYPGGKY